MQSLECSLPSAVGCYGGQGVQNAGEEAERAQKSESSQPVNPRSPPQGLRVRRSNCQLQRFDRDFELLNLRFDPSVFRGPHLMF